MRSTVKISIILLLAGLVISSYGQNQQTKRTLAVLYFDNNSVLKKEEMEPLSKGLADMFITEFSKVEKIQVVERAQLQQILEEMKLAQAGVLDQATSQEVGKILGAEGLLLGSYMLMFDGKLRIDIRLVEVETGKTIKAEGETGSPKNLSNMVDKLVKKSLSNLNVRLSKEDNQRLGRKDNNNFDVAVLFAKGIHYEDAKDYTNARKMYLLALRKNPKFVRARMRLRNLPK